MKEIKGNLWSYATIGSWLCITTNGFVKKNGECVMGAGIAKQAAEKFPEIKSVIGRGILKNGNIPMMLEEYRLITFPVKHVWWERADLDLIENSAKIISEAMFSPGALIPTQKVYSVRPGCGNGGLDWGSVRPVLDKYFPTPQKPATERFFIIQN